MKRISLLVAGLSALLLVLGTVQMTSADRGGRDGRKPSRVIHLTERAVAVSFQDADPPGPSLGDRLIFSSNLYDKKGNLVGRDGADCLIVRVDPSSPPGEQQTVQCVISVDLFDEGQITVQGLAQGTENLFAVTGGTGAFRTAKGEAFAKDIVPLVEAEITIKLFDDRD